MKRRELREKLKSVLTSLEIPEDMIKYCLRGYKLSIDISYFIKKYESQNHKKPLKISAAILGVTRTVKTRLEVL